MRLITSLFITFVGAATASAGVIEVSLKLPTRPRLGLTGTEKIALAPFILATGDEAVRTDRAAKVDLQAEFARYLRKELAKETKLEVVTAAATRLPGSDMRTLAGSRDFWREIAARTGADYVVSGVLDFDIQDKAGFKSEEYVSPIDGRTYYRQVMVEATGFVFDIVLAVFDGETGEKVVEENFRDFKEFDQRQYDEILGLFENLRSLESQILGVFVSREMTANRYLLVP